MRSVIIAAFLLSFTGLRAQVFVPGSFIDPGYRGSWASSIRLNDSISSKKTFFTHYSGLSTSFMISKAGTATVVAAPMGIQLNRRLNNNVFAFAGVSIAPAYVNFNQSFMSADYSKNSGLNRVGNLGVYSRAELGLQYINDDRTFSISGSIGIERNSYPASFYNQSNSRHSQILPANK